MTINLTIPDTIATRVIDAVCARTDYAGYLTTTKTPISKAQWVKNQVVNFLKNYVKEYESFNAAETARTTAVTKVDSEINIT